jgi:hypothetical protein
MSLPPAWSGLDDELRQKLVAVARRLRPVVAARGNEAALRLKMLLRDARPASDADAVDSIVDTAIAIARAQ